MTGPLRRGLAFAAALALVGFGFLGWIVLRDVLAPSGHRPAPLPLPSEPISGLLWPDGAPRGTVVFLDGAEGWFAIDDPALLAEVEIGFFGTRLFEAVFGAPGHLALHCGASGKIVWAVEAGRIARQLAYCNPERMDLANLRPLARPVTLHEQSLTRPEAIALTDRIAADPALVAVTLPRDFEAFDAFRDLALPAHWYRWGDEAASGGRVDAAVGAALGAHLADLAGQYELQDRSRAAQELTRFEDGQPREIGPAVNRDGTVVILTEVHRIRQHRFRVVCSPAACAALEGVDPGAALAPGRDIGLLERALDAAVALERNPDEGMFTPGDLRDDQVKLGPVTPVTYDVRWVSDRG